jgi:hypothetical protein
MQVAGRNPMKSPIHLLIAASILTLAGCTTVAPMPLPDGSMGYALECNGMLDSADECYARVAGVCPQGFEIVTESRFSVMTFDPFDRTLYVRCTKSAGA